MTSDGQQQGRLLVVSNRLPYNLPDAASGKKPRRNVGGLVNALEPVLTERGGCWYGWDGTSLGSSAAVASRVARPPSYTTDSGVELHGVPLSAQEVRLYYHGLSNRTLWPLFHNIPDKAVFNTEDYRAYVEVNRRFAEIVGTRLSDGDRVWVHDYHLLLVPALLRERGFSGRIDFFLHIPFPAPELFLALPWRRHLLDGLLACDTVAFHTGSYRENFIRTARILREVKVDELAAGDWLLEGGSRKTVTRAAPLGVDSDEFARIAELPAVEAATDRIRRSVNNRNILFSADRLDYTKGIKDRLLAVERFIQLHPERAGTFTFLQVVVPSRNQVEEYHDLKREIDEEVGRINGQYGREGWIPIHYRYRALNREELVAHYRAASVALVTPLRDGLNLVAAEFVASRTDLDGVLVLSEFAGVAQQLRDAVKVNPYNIDGCADAIHTALEMDPTDRRFRMGRMLAQVRANTTVDWSKRCLAAPRFSAPAQGGVKTEPDAATVALRDTPV